MKRNLILMTSLMLVFIMSFSVVNAGWFTGKVTDDENPWLGPYKLCETDSFFCKNSRSINVGEGKYQVSLKSVSNSEAVIEIDGELSSGLTMGTTAIVNGLGIKMVKVIYSSKVGAKNYVTFSLREEKGGEEPRTNCVGGVCNLYEGDNVNYLEHNFKIEYISATQVRLNVDKQIIGSFGEGETYILSDGRKIIIKKISFSSKTGLSNWVTFEIISSPQTETSIELVDNFVQIDTVIKDGHLVLPVLYSSGNINSIGQDNTRRLETTNNSILYYEAQSSYNEGFIATWNNAKDGESYYLRALVSQDGTTGANKTTIINKLTNRDICTNLEPGQTCTIGNVVLRIFDANYYNAANKEVTFIINTGGSFDKLYTNDGHIIQLPTSNNMKIWIL